MTQKTEGDSSESSQGALAPEVQEAIEKAVAGVKSAKDKEIAEHKRVNKQLVESNEELRVKLEDPENAESILATKRQTSSADEIKRLQFANEVAELFEPFGITAADLIKYDTRKGMIAFAAEKAKEAKVAPPETPNPPRDKGEPSGTLPDKMTPYQKVMVGLNQQGK